MPALAACYFCGDAVGASLEEHAIPSEAPADDQVSVTLCADCHGKLAALLEELPVGGSDAGSGSDPRPAASEASTTSAGSVLDDEAPDDDNTDPAPPGDQDAADATEASEVDTVSTPGSETDTAQATAADSDTVAEPAPEPDVDPLAGEQEPIFAGDDGTLLGEGDPADEQEDSRPFSSDDGDGAAASATTGESDDAVDAADASDPIAAPPAKDATDPGADADSTATDPTDADSADTDSPATDREPTAADREASAVEVSRSGGGSAQRADSNAASGDAADRGAADGPLADVSPRTYNRVVRLLQNREFPVDRDDFEALATSAYELDHGECAAALDGAIEKGLLEERDGQLHRPE